MKKGLLTNLKKHSLNPSFNCRRCKLDKKCVSPRMPFFGEGKNGILIVGEAPGANEDEQNRQFVGKSGGTLRASLEKINIDIDEDCWCTNAVNCRPTKEGRNREPTTEINYCRPFLWEKIRELKPKVILLLGKVAVKSLILDIYPKGAESISTWRGWTIPDRKCNAWIIPTYHPSYIDRMSEQENGVVVEKLFRGDLNKARQMAKQDLPEPLKQDDHIRTLTIHSRALEYLDRIKEGDEITFDYETTGLKPQMKGHEIVYVSVYHQGSSFSWKPFYDSFTKKNETMDLLKKILINPNIKKIAQNIKFEHVWSKVILGITVRGWIWDTMQAAHILDNRHSICSLKFQTYINFGITDYSLEIEPYLKGDGKYGANSFNRIKQAPPIKMLKYSAYDSFFTHKLYEEQKKQLELEEKGLWREEFIRDGALVMADVEFNGIRIDKKCIERERGRTKRKADYVLAQFEDHKLIKEWKKTHPNFNPLSTQQLAKFLDGFDLDLEETEKGNIKTGIDALDKIVRENKELSFLEKILDLRKWRKIVSTYLDNFELETVDNFLHPFYNLHSIISYRSSSSDPNWQNIPERNKAAREICKKIIIPRKDRLLVEMDFSGIEVRIAACYHLDSNMIEDITDPSKDMHRDMAVECYMLDLWEQCTKDTRFSAKSNFVFAQFYGSWFKNCARKLWEDIDKFKLCLSDETPMKKNLRRKGIKNYQDFENHIEKVEKRFWNKRYPVYKNWKETHWIQYRKHCQFVSKLGFVYQGLMSKNEACNYPIQGVAFQCLLWCLIEISKELRIREMKTKLIGQTHDSHLSDVVSDEYNEYVDLCKEIMEVRLVKKFPWIIVPITVDIEVAPMNESLFKAKEVELTNPCSTCACKYRYVFGNEIECPICGEREEK